MHARQQLTRVERLAQIIVSANFKAHNAIHIFTFCGQHDDGCFVIGGTQTPTDRQTVFSRQHQVQHDQVDRFPLQDAIEVFTVFSHHHFKAFLTQIAAQQITDASIIIHHHDLVGTYRIGLVHLRVSFSTEICNKLGY